MSREPLTATGRAVVAALLVAWALALLWLGLGARVDWGGPGGQYGVSAGTPTTYCSADWPAGLSCQSGD